MSSRNKFKRAKDKYSTACQMPELFGIDLSGYKGEQRKDKIARNLVDYEAGKTIFATAMGVILKSNVKQESLFGDVW